jgi:hypothetical protein
MVTATQASPMRQRPTAAAHQRQARRPLAPGVVRIKATLIKCRREFQHTRDFRVTHLEVAQNGISSK